MNLTLDALLVIDAIARTGSFSAAANELSRVPSAITYSVQKIESDLGIKLFVREGNRPRLTPSCERLLVEGREILKSASRLEKTLSLVEHGWESSLYIAIGELASLSDLFPLINKFNRGDKYTHLNFSDQVLSGSWDALISGRADLIVGASFDGPPGGGYIAKQLGTVSFSFVMAPDHPLALEDEPISQSRIKEQTGIVAHDTAVKLPLRTAGPVFSGQHIITVPSMDAKLRAIKAGLGVGSLPSYQVKSALERGELVAKQIEGGTTDPPFYVARTKNHSGKALLWFYNKFCEPEFFSHKFIKPEYNI